MDRRVVDEKFESLARCVARIESKQPFTLNALRTDFDLQDIVCINLERAVQSAVDIAATVNAVLPAPSPTTMSGAIAGLHSGGVLQEATAVRLRHAVGCRNIMVHEYTSIDWRIVHAVCTQHLDDFRRFVAEVDAWLSANA